MDQFWHTEYGQNLLSVEQTEIDKKLQSPNSCTLEELFDEDELLQQCSNKNKDLIAFLSKQANITKLVSYITRPWQEHMEQIINHLREQQEQPQAQTESNNDTKQNKLPSLNEDDQENKDGDTPHALADALMSLEETNDPSNPNQSAQSQVILVRICEGS